MAKVMEEKTYTLFGGEVVTEDDLEVMAEEIEQGIGFPAFIVVAPELFDAAEKRAGEEGRSVNELASEALEKFLSS
jgi:hypothetical protein